MARVVPHLFSLVVFLFLSVKLTEAVQVDTWPEGTYGLPKAKIGCPVSPKTQWTTGWRFQDTEDNNPGNSKSLSFHLDMVVGKDINRTFCMKVKNEGNAEWPRGSYCIFKKGNCPKGFQEGYVFWDDENNKNINRKGGTLPDGVYNRDTLIYYCCRGDGDKLNPVPLPVISPFYLKAFNTSECQRIQGAIATKEYVRFDNEDRGNKDRQNGSFPHGAKIADHMLTYCYYESCHYTYSLQSSEQIQFSSPNFFVQRYPLAQKCTWRFVAPETNTVHITFLEVDLEEGDSIVIKSGWDSGPNVGTIEKTKPPNRDGYNGQSAVFMVFESSSSDLSRKQSKGFRGIFKATPSKESPSNSDPEWPSGTYGLPRPRLGCPRSDKVTWSTGWRFQDTEDSNADNRKSESFHMGAIVMKNDVNRSFCIATENKGARMWPKGQYCIYKKGTCPKGLTEGYIFFDDENFKNQNDMGGVLPDGVYNEDTKLFYCCRTDGDKLEPVSLPVRIPFYLMAYNSSECQQVNWALATKEFIRFDNEDQNNKDAWNGTHAYVKGDRSLTISYCYYEACHFTISEESQQFVSPHFLSDGYPNSQLCTWRFLVRKASPQRAQADQILIKFPEFQLRKGKDGDAVRIYSGWDEKAPLLAEFNGDNPPPVKGVASNSSVVYLVFTSDSRGRSRGFRGLFLNQPFDPDDVPKQQITLPVVPTAIITTAANQSVNVSTPPQKKTASTPPAAQGKQTGRKSSAPVNVIIPVVIVIIIIAAVVTAYCVRRTRMERRFKKAISRSQAQLVNNTDLSYTDLNSQEYDSSEELQDIFPTG